MLTEREASYHQYKLNAFYRKYIEKLGGLFVIAEQRRATCLELGKLTHEEILDDMLREFEKLLIPLQKDLAKLNKEREKLYKQSQEA